MKEFAVILGTAHRMREPGKHSPDKKFREPKYSREIISELKPILESYGIKTFVDIEDLDLPKTMQTPSSKLERNRELNLRCNIVNSLCDSFDCIYVSIHNDASSGDNKWHSAHGWSVRVSPYASDNSRKLASFMADSANSHSLFVRKPTLKQKYWEQNLKVLNDTNCPAILTENLFQDNKNDVAFLLSDEGRHIIERVHVEGILRYKEYWEKLYRRN